ncbi:MAG TPA: cobalamin biosynthesis protein CobD [Porphyromonadaceae bacterium]|nr:cobalamin biosynthesis protein CobD [Porphyromonadaceae bacterium]
MEYMIVVLPLLFGWILDRILGDPVWLPHPVVGFGNVISFFEHRLNIGKDRKVKGAVMAISLMLFVFMIFRGVLSLLSPFPIVKIIVETIGVFYCLAGTTLSREVSMVFAACREGLDAARRQVARIVGRDTGSLDEQEIKTAALETLAENLSDGVIAPMFWYLLLGLPGMMAYKMVNTLDSMIGYKSERYKDFGCFAAKMDDVANYIPARLTSFLMVISIFRFSLLRFVRKYGRCHASPNSGYPEAALAGILDCRFGGTHDYFGEAVYKPYIGSNPKLLTDSDLRISLRVCLQAELLMLILCFLLRTYNHFYI